MLLLYHQEHIPPLTPSPSFSIATSLPQSVRVVTVSRLHWEGDLIQSLHLSKNRYCHIVLQLQHTATTACRFLTVTLVTMDCFGDFCLTCDAQTNGTVFCSQACQLAELDNYASSAPSSPVQYDTNTVRRRSSTRSNSGLYLPPAIDFSAYRTASSKSLESVKTSKSNSFQISEQAQNDLNNYVTSFDQTRTVRRRISLQSTEGSRTASRR